VPGRVGGDVGCDRGRQGGEDPVLADPFDQPGGGEFATGILLDPRHAEDDAPLAELLPQLLQVSADVTSSWTLASALRASAAAYAAYRAGSPAAICATTVAVSSAVVDSGPTDSCRDEPKTAYTSSETRTAHNTTTVGSPATSA